jgi:hypothetical protein
MEADTGFDPLLQGFHFRNRFSGADVIDELIETRRLDELAGLDLPTGLEGAIGRIRDARFWGAFGLCGGMTWAALDFSIENQLPPSKTTVPDRDTALFKTLVSRQADSMQRGRLMSRCLRYQMIPQVSSFWRPWGRSLGEITEKLEWPKVRTSLDLGRPVPICLVRVRGLSNPDKHHQVLATRYSVDAKDVLTIGFYDPNRPGEYPAITVRLGTRDHDLQPIQTTGEPLHGFFVTDYEPA